MVAGFTRRFGMLSFVLLTAAAAQVARAGDAGCEPQRSGLRAYADPESGALIAPPAAVGGGGAAAHESDTTALELVPAPGSAGGVMVDLRGQFLHATRAHAVAGGDVAHECAPRRSGR